MDKRLTAARILSVVVMLAGVLVMAGWVFHIEELTNILPIWITMKFTTALCFFLCGVILYALGHEQVFPDSNMGIFFPIAALIILLFMSTFLAEEVLQVSLGIEDLFFAEETVEIARHWAPGVPSVAVMIVFVQMAMVAILAMLKEPLLSRYLLWSGRLITALGGLAVAGYVFQTPVLRYDIPGWCNPMAVHTAILSFFTGLGVLAVGAASAGEGRASC